MWGTPLHNANGAPDNTLLVLFRHLIENVIRLRYLAQEPEKRIFEFEFMEMKGRLNVIGREPTEGEAIAKAKDRERCLKNEEECVQKLLIINEVSSRNRLPKTTVKRMCEVTNSADIYTTYALFSQFEHSTGVGLMATVVDPTTQKLVFNKELNEGQIEIFWNAIGKMIIGAAEAIDMLNSHRPKQ